MKKALVVAALAAVLAAGAGVPAVQAQGINLWGDDKRVDPEAEQKRQDSERAYRAATQRIPDKAAPNDPWGNMRSVPDAKPAVTAKPRQKP